MDIHVQGQVGDDNNNRNDHAVGDDSRNDNNNRYDHDDGGLTVDVELVGLPADSGMDVQEQVGDDNNNRADHAVGDDSRSSASEDDIPGPSRPGGTQVRGQPYVAPQVQPPASSAPPPHSLISL